jgi:large subunit ribosomal protein L2
LGLLVYNIPFFSLKIKKYAICSAGCSGLIMTRTANFCKIRLPSGNLKLFSSKSIVSLGCLSNPLHKKIILGKAGRARWLHKKPCVRGVAMNPIDHPHGGGQGKLQEVALLVHLG